MIAPQCKQPCLILASVGVLVFLYFEWLSRTYGPAFYKNDFLNTKVVDVPMLDNCCSWWPVSHFILFAIAGYMYPDCGWPILGLGVAWEGFEMSVNYFTSTKRQFMELEDGSFEYSQNWWAGSSKDILFNTAGFIVGRTLRKCVV